MDELKTKFKDRCAFKSHSHVKRMLINYNLTDPNVVEFFLSRACFRCIDLFLAAKGLDSNVFSRLPPHLDLPLDIIKSLWEHPTLMQIIQADRPDLFQLAVDDSSANAPASKRRRVDLTHHLLDAIKGRATQIVCFILSPKYAWNLDLDRIVNEVCKVGCSWEILKAVLDHDSTYTTTILSRLAAAKKFELVEAVLKYLKSDCDLLSEDPKGQISFCVALGAGAPLRTIKAFLEVKPDLIRELDAMDGVFLLHLAMDGEQPEVIYFLLTQRLNPLKRNQQGHTPVFHQMQKFEEGGCCQRTDKEVPEATEEAIEMLLPLIYCTNSIYQLDFGELFAVCAFTARLKRPGPFKACIETFYGPRVNSKYPLIKRLLNVFDLERFVSDQKKFKHGRQLCAFIHDPWRFRQKPESMLIMAEQKFANRLIHALREVAFDDDDRLEVFYETLKHWKDIDLIFNDSFFGLSDLYLPIKPHPEIAARMYRALRKLGHANFDLDLKQFASRIVRYHNVAEEFGDVFRALYALYPVPLETWRQIMQTIVSIVELREKHRDIFAQIEDLMPRIFVKEFGVQKSHVVNLNHLCRLTIRETIEEKVGSKELHSAVQTLSLPTKMKNYLVFVDKLMEK